MLAYSGGGKFVAEGINLSELLREMEMVLRRSLPRNVDFRLEIAAGLPPVEADPGQIHQLVTNLAINGAEALEGRRGTVTIRTGSRDVDSEYIENFCAGQSIAPGRCVFLEVEDTGGGIAAEAIPRIFDPFFSTKSAGRGLGLAAARGIIRGHKASVSVRSVPGTGTAFQMLFPAASRASVREEAPASPARSTPGTILVVDDEETVRRTAKTVLERWGYRVILAENGREGVERFRDAPGISLVLLDLSMPVMNGEECLRALKGIRPEVPVVLSSGFNEAEAIHRFTGKGLSGFLQKPYRASVLAERVKATLGQAASAQSAGASQVAGLLN
jgi:CheY-like chemotaxis protein